jgi:hypothetical protein
VPIGTAPTLRECHASVGQLHGAQRVSGQNAD